MKIFGKYGNADIFKTKDWSEVYEYEKDPATGFENVKFSNLGTSTWDSTSETCTIYSSVLIKVIYHGMGFKDNQQ